MVRSVFAILLMLVVVEVALAQETPIPPTPIPNIAPILPDMTRTAQILLSARSDMEILANNTIGAAERPSGWNGTFDTSDPQMALKARLDLELLAEQLTGAGNRPVDWFGTQPTSAYSTARDVRHDLELLADAAIAPNVRPPNWVGDLPVMRCGRATQALVLLLQSRGLYTPISTPGSPTYCSDLEAEISVFTEINLLDGTLATAPTPAPTDVPDVENANAPVSIVTFGALAYYDRGALELAGAMPQGLIVTPVARSYAQFSRMMLIRGDGFEVFVDYQDTTLDQPTFDALGDVTVLDISPVCTIEWCLPPG